MAILRVCAVAIMIAISVSSAVAQSRGPFEKWLGPQKNSLINRNVVREAIDRAKHEKLSCYNFSLLVVKGSDLKLPTSENPVVIFDGSEFKEVMSFTADANSKYLLSTFQLKKDQLGWRFYTLNVRVSDGALKGAIIHLRNDRIQETISEPCIAVYRIPSEILIEVGEVPFEVVSYFAK